MQPRRGALVGAMATAAISMFVGTTAHADDEVTTPSAPPAVFDEVTSGTDAIETLGAQLPAVAATVGMTPTELTSELLSDPELHVDLTGKLMYVDEGLTEYPQPAPGEAPVAEPAPFPLNDTFKLHSKPTASRVIYLDFTGHVASGTGWNSSYNAGNDVTAIPFDADGDTATFSTEERETIQSVWQQIADDFAPFNIDVTTEEPDQAKITRTDSSDQEYGTRLVVSNTDFILSACGCGGIAYLGVFDAPSGHASYQPAWVFTKNNQDAKFIAEAGSHEVGHNLGLAHDGRGKGDSSGVGNEGYYTGHANWAPIMGVGYYHSVSQWSKGEYKGANNKQDDVLVMQQNGAPLVTDDYGDKPVGAEFLGATFPVAEDGIISFAKDVDYFKFNAGAGPITITVDPAPNSPNLDISADLLTAKNKSLGKSNPVSAESGGESTGMNAEISATLAVAGTYYVKVDGVANGGGANGYTDYGSLGTYSLTVEAEAPTGLANLLPVAKVTLPLATVGVPGPVTMTNAGSTDPDGKIAATAWNFGDSTAAGAGASVAHTYTTPGLYEIVMAVTDNSGATTEKTVKLKAVPAVTVDSLTSGTLTASGKTYAAVTVKIVDANDAAIPGAKVTVSWAGTKKVTGTGTTGVDGTVVVKGPVTSAGAAYTATVTKAAVKDKAFNAGLATTISVAQTF